MTEVYMMVGPAGVGKSSTISDAFGKGFTHLSRDKAGGKVIDLLDVMLAAIRRGEEKIVLDCTFIKPEDRKPFIQAAKNAGARIYAWFFNAPHEVAQFNICWRMCERHGKVLRTKEDYAAARKDPNIFPPAVHFKMYKDLVPPSKLEGFDDVTVIKAAAWSLPAEFVNKAVILDYDGTLRRTKTGNKYPVTPDDIEILPGVSEKLESLKQEGYLLLGASNQSGVAKNNPPMAVAHECFKQTNSLVGVDIDYDFDYSPAGPIVSWHRKPMPGMGVDFIWKYKLDPSKTVYVGDLTTDKTFAKRCRFEFVHADEFFSTAKV